MSFRSRLSLGIILIFSFALLFVLEKSMTLTPGPESQSVFFKQYDPAPVLNSFRATNGPLSMPRKVESTGNWGFVSHRETFHPALSIESGRREAMLAALQRDAEEQIRKASGTIIREHAEEPSGFQVGYQIGPTRGAILVKPAKPLADSRSNAFDLDITIQEMWSEAVANQKKKS